MKVILIATTGTSLLYQQKNTDKKIKAKFGIIFPKYKIISAVTSDKIIKIIENKYKKCENDIETVLTGLYAKGCAEVIIMPFYIVKGIEYQNLLKKCDKYKKLFKKFKIADPLLNSKDDIAKVASAILNSANKTAPNSAVVLAGHGSRFNGSLYDEIEKHFDKSKFFMHTINKKSITDLANKIKEQNYTDVLLLPFMITAGIHAQRDIAGSCGSVKYMLEKQGLNVQCVLKGLEEYDEITDTAAEHCKSCI